MEMAVRLHGEFSVIFMAEYDSVLSTMSSSMKCHNMMLSAYIQWQTFKQRL